MLLILHFKNMYKNTYNKTGSHQCTRAVCNTFAEINSTVTPWCIDALFGVRIPFQSLVQSPEGNPDSSPPVQRSSPCLHRPQNASGKLISETFLHVYLSCDTRNAWSGVTGITHRVFH